jgi:hypothetical protein
MKLPTNKTIVVKNIHEGYPFGFNIIENGNIK